MNQKTKEEQEKVRIHYSNKMMELDKNETGTNKSDSEQILFSPRYFISHNYPEGLTSSKELNQKNKQ